MPAVFQCKRPDQKGNTLLCPSPSTSPSLRSLQRLIRASELPTVPPEIAAFCCTNLRKVCSAPLWRTAAVYLTHVFCCSQIRKAIRPSITAFL